MCASAASPSSVASDLPSSTPAPRSRGTFRRLTQLRTYTQSHSTSHPLNSLPRSQNSWTRVVGRPLTFRSSSRADSPVLSSANESQYPTPYLGHPQPVNYFIRSTGDSNTSRASLAEQDFAHEPARSVMSNHGVEALRTEARNMAPAVVGGLVSVIPDSRRPSGNATPSRSEGRSSEATLHRQNGGVESTASTSVDRRPTVSKPKQGATIRFYPYQDSHQNSRSSLPFAPVTRTLPSEDSVIRVGRYSERDGIPIANPTEPSDAPVGFKSKVVSRKHCEFSLRNGQWHIKDVGSSSGTFLNHMRLSQPNMASRLYAVRDGDIVQLGIDFRGGEEMIFRCVRIRIECNRTWQRRPNEFNKNTESLIKNLGKGDAVDYAGCRECSICLGSVLRPYQCLFMAACAHVWHYKCISRLIHSPDYPMFQCPNCRAYTDLTADVDDPNEFEEDRNGETSDTNEEVDHITTRREDQIAVELIPHDNGVLRKEFTDDAALTATMKNLHLKETNAPGQGTVAVNNIDVSENDSVARVERSASIPILVQQSPTQVTDPSTRGQSESNGNASMSIEIFEDNPMTPRNDSGPLAFDGRAGRL